MIFYVFQAIEVLVFSLFSDDTLMKVLKQTEAGVSSELLGIFPPQSSSGSC